MNLSRRGLFLSMAAFAGCAVLPRLPRADLAFNPRQEVIDMVRRAADAISTHGFPRALSKTESEIWKRPARGLYVFIVDTHGTLLLHPDRKMEGRNVAGTTDPNGKAFIREMIESTMANAEKGTWTDYVWPSPTGNIIAPKHTYSKLVGDYIVAAGYLAEDT